MSATLKDVTENIKNTSNTNIKRKHPSMDDVGQITKAFNASSPEGKEIMLAFANMSEEDRQSLLSTFQEKTKPNEQPTFQDLQQARLKEIQSRYTPFPKNKKITVENILAHLKNKFKNDLMYFGAKENNIYLDELRKIEPLTKKMYEKLSYENKKENSVPLIINIIPKKKEKVTKRLKNYTITPETTLKEHEEIRSIKQQRKKLDHNPPTLDAA